MVLKFKNIDRIFENVMIIKLLYICVSIVRLVGWNRKFGYKIVNMYVVIVEDR